MGRVMPTYEEIICTLKRTTLKTIVVEGKDDKEIYQSIENCMDDITISFVKLDCRNNVIKASNESCLESKANIVFLVDKDKDYILGEVENIISKGKRIITTEGYSIENDVIVGGKEIVLRFLNEEEKEELNLILKKLTYWFYYQIVNNGKLEECPQNTVLGLSLEEVQSHYPQCTNCERLRYITEDNFESYVRGKTLLWVYGYVFRKPERKLKYHEHHVIDICLKGNHNGNAIVQSVIRRAIDLIG